MLFLSRFALLVAVEDENSMVVMQDLDVNPVFAKAFRDCFVWWPWHWIQAFAGHFTSMMTTSSASCPSGIFSEEPNLALACLPEIRVTDRAGKKISINCHQSGGAQVALSNRSDTLCLELLTVRGIALIVWTSDVATTRGLGAWQCCRAERRSRDLQDCEVFFATFERVTHGVEVNWTMAAGWLVFCEITFRLMLVLPSCQGLLWAHGMAFGNAEWHVNEWSWEIWANGYFWVAHPLSQEKSLRCAWPAKGWPCDAFTNFHFDAAHRRKAVLPR